MSWTIAPAAQFPTYAARWNVLHAEHSRSPLLHLDFVEPLLTEFGTGKEIIACYQRNGRTVAMAIMGQGRMGAWETFQPSQAPVGMWMHSPAEDIASLLRELMNALPGFPLVVSITQCDPALAPRPRDHGSLRTLAYVDTAKITVSGEFADFWNARGKNLRANLKKQRSRLLREGIHHRLQESREPEDIADGIMDYGQLESAGWKANGGTAIHPDNAQGRFYQSMLARFCRRGRGSIIRYWFNEKLVAMDLRIEGDECLIFLKTTYDEEVPSHFSPALLMREETCQKLFEEKKFKTLEFYGKAMEWQLKWTNELRPMYHVNNYRWTTLLQLHSKIKKHVASLRQSTSSGAGHPVSAADSTTE